MADDKNIKGNIKGNQGAELFSAREKETYGDARLTSKALSA